MTLFLTDINKQHDCTADDDQDDTNIDRCLSTETLVDQGIHEDSEPQEWSLDGLKETPSPGEPFRPNFLEDEHL